ncbi:MAG: peptide-methionine (S)-S-oxide reductase MsrA [Candidatus Peribacteraceae bacterium]|nr:peptide-methionine (S)-S-oxide reductase MsrA [Candidatus Peribacteraceae bacterium]
MGKETEIAVFGGGCFWCTEAVFRSLRGVQSVAPGYAGGEKENPTYREVCSGKTGHAEVIRIEFNPKEISFEDLLNVFFATHDPTTLNRQGADVGTQYRSAILTTTKEQQKIAEKFIAEANSGEFRATLIVTEIKALEKFWPAEDYHREYYEKNSDAPYCQAVIDPKLVKFKKRFAELLK